MSAPITEADRLAALLALAHATPPVSERVIADVAQMRADARAAERLECATAIEQDAEKNAACFSDLPFASSMSRAAGLIMVRGRR